MKMIIDFVIVTDGSATEKFYSIVRKEFNTDLVPVVGMALEDPAWKESRPIQRVTINPTDGYYHVNVSTESCRNAATCEYFRKMCLQH